MRRRIVTAALLGALPLALIGCGAKKANTPADATANLAEAISGNDEDAFIVCFEDARKHQGALKHLFATLTSATAHKDTDMRAAAVEWIKAGKITIDGDKAVCTISSATKLHLIRTDGAWLIKPAEFLSGITEEVIAPGISADVGNG